MPLAYIGLGLLLVAGAFYVIPRLASMDAVQRMRLLWWVLIGACSAVGILMMITGRPGFILFPLLFAAPWAWRSRKGQPKASRPSRGKSSRVDTSYLSMELDEDTGRIDGTVLAGRFRGRRVPEMSLDDLLDLLAECRAADQRAVPILEAYLERVHPRDWRARAEARRTAGRASAMTRAEAYDILGLAPGASSAAIREAHRRLMQKNHPDHGGSTYLAARINQAKDLLLGS